MTDRVPRSKQPDLKPGKLPLEQLVTYGPPHPAQFAIPPFLEGEEPVITEARPRIPKSATSKLKIARDRVRQLAAEVRDEAFDEWVLRCLVVAKAPDEWTQATVLYENYLKRAPSYGWNRRDRRLVQQELSTATTWGRMMGSQFEKKRRSKGWYYPLRLKQGA
jgi:hypothetical protein